MGVTSLTKATASSQSRNLKDLTSLRSSSARHPSTRGSRTAIWSDWSGGVPPLQGTHFSSASSVVICALSEGSASAADLAHGSGRAHEVGLPDLVPLLFL